MPAEAAKAAKEESIGGEKLGLITVDSERSGPGRGAPPELHWALSSCEPPLLWPPGTAALVALSCAL